jgi:hypothetical protein
MSGKDKLKLIAEYRQLIHDTCGIDPQLKSVTNNDLSRLFDMYNTYFFGNSVREILAENRYNIEFVAEWKPQKGHKIKNISKTAGLCSTYTKTCIFQLMFNIPIILQPFEINKYAFSGGMQCNDPLSCLQLTFEHEVCHMLVNMLILDMLKFGPIRKKVQPHGTLFKCLVYEFFGQTDVRHELHFGEKGGRLNPSRLEENKKKINEIKHKLKLGYIVENPHGTFKIVKIANKNIHAIALTTNTPKIIIRKTYVLPIGSILRIK